MTPLLSDQFLCQPQYFGGQLILLPFRYTLIQWICGADTNDPDNADDDAGDKQRVAPHHRTAHTNAHDHRTDHAHSDGCGCSRLCRGPVQPAQAFRFVLLLGGRGIFLPDAPDLLLPGGGIGVGKSFLFSPIASCFAYYSIEMLKFCLRFTLFKNLTKI